MKSKHIHIFKPGKHVASSGAALDFSDAQLSASVAAYDPAKHEAPIVVGHPTHDAPAYGWVKSLRYADGLEAEPHQVDPAFAEMVERGAFKKISASFYTPDSPSNPVPGVFYLRHVGFLGAQPPAVKGLRSPEFADAEQGVIEFADWGDIQNASLWRQLKNWFIGEKGLEIANEVIPEYAIAELETEARKESNTAGAPAFSESNQSLTKGDEMSAEDKARLAALETENATLKTDNATLKTSVASFTETQAKAKRDVIHVEHLAFCETLIVGGKLLPVNKDSTVALLDNMAAADTAIEFGEGDAKKSETPLAIYRKQLEALPKIVEFGEAAGHKKAAGEELTDPSDIAAKAVEFQEAELKAGRTISATAAVAHVTKGNK